MRDQRALRRPGRARRVDQAGRVVGARRDHLEFVVALLEQVPELDVVVADLAADDVLEVRQLGRERAHVVVAAGVDDRDARAAVAQPVLERLGAEQDRERQRYRAELVDREVRDDGFDRLRQHDRNAVAAADAVRAQRVGESGRRIP